MAPSSAFRIAPCRLLDHGQGPGVCGESVATATSPVVPMPSSKSPLVSHRQPVPSLPVRSNPRSPALGQRNRNGSGQEEEANGPNGISRQKKKQQTASRSSLSTGIQFRLVPFPQFAPHRCVIDRQLEGEAPATDAERSSPSRRRFQGRRRSLVFFSFCFGSHEQTMEPSRGRAAAAAAAV